MQPSVNRVSPPGTTRVRVAAGVLSLVLASVYTIQFAAAFERHAYLGAMFISIACLHLMYGVMLLTQPWAMDSIGRAHADAAMHSRRWYRAGIASNLILVALLSLSLVGVIPSLSGGVLEFLSVVLGLLLIACLMTLTRLVRS